MYTLFVQDCGQQFIEQVNAFPSERDRLWPAARVPNTSFDFPKSFWYKILSLIKLINHESKGWELTGACCA